VRNRKVKNPVIVNSTVLLDRRYVGLFTARVPEQHTPVITGTQAVVAVAIEGHSEHATLMPLEQ
jgi:hypothetical protein